jgi:hypothetical protein
VSGARSSSQQSHHLIETAVGDPPQYTQDHNCSTSRIGKAVLDDPDGSAQFIHFSVDVREVGLQFNDARFHIHFSSGRLVTEVAKLDQSMQMVN